MVPLRSRLIDIIDFWAIIGRFKWQVVYTLRIPVVSQWIPWWLSVKSLSEPCRIPIESLLFAPLTFCTIVDLGSSGLSHGVVLLTLSSHRSGASLSVTGGETL